MKMFAIAVGLVGLPARAHAQRLTLTIGTTNRGRGSIVVAATDFGIVRVDATDSGQTKALDIPPLEARDYARSPSKRQANSRNASRWATTWASS